MDVVENVVVLVRITQWGEGGHFQLLLDGLSLKWGDSVVIVGGRGGQCGAGSEQLVATPQGGSSVHLPSEDVEDAVVG